MADQGLGGEGCGWLGPQWRYPQVYLPADEEEEEEEESEDEMPQEISLNSNESGSLSADPMEPPPKLARTDSRGIFVQALPSS